MAKPTNSKVNTARKKCNSNLLRRTKIIFTNKRECEPNGQTEAHIDHMQSAKGGKISGGHRWCSASVFYKMTFWNALAKYTAFPS